MCVFSGSHYGESRTTRLAFSLLRKRFEVFFFFYFFFIWKPAKDAYWAGTLESTTRRLGGMSVSQSPAVTATLWPTVTRRLPPPKLAIIYAS